jgi:hypothetical protein
MTAPADPPPPASWVAQLTRHTPILAFGAALLGCVTGAVAVLSWFKEHKR